MILDYIQILLLILLMYSNIFLSLSQYILHVPIDNYKLLVFTRMYKLVVFHIA